jgi:hypothetical protein
MHSEPSLIRKEVVAQDNRGQWVKGTIVSYRGESSTMEVKIHFYGTEPHPDEWIVYPSQRIRLLEEEGSLSTAVHQNSKNEVELLVRKL